MPRSLWKTLLLCLLAGMILAALWAPFRRAMAGQWSVPAAYQYVDQFLYAPYPGTASEESIFDHSSPNYSYTDGQIIGFTGDIAYKICPNPAPAGVPPPSAGACEVAPRIYWSYSVGDWMSYNGHDGIDFGMQYRPLYAAADSDQVVYSGWQDPMDHTAGYGIYVRLHHLNGYTTYYGHMSAVAVQSCTSVGCSSLEHGDFIGYSGSTGNSTGPHLHFSVFDPAMKRVDPYGWTGAYADPWPYNQRNSLWVEYPSVIPSAAGTYTVLPSGEALAYPAAPASGVVVDDSSENFSAVPSGCWTVTTTAPYQSENGSMRYTEPIISGSATCMARWTFPGGQPAGLYAVYIRIPSVRANSEGALYAITHSGRTDQVTVNQDVFPNPYHVSDGWLYVGEYDFSVSGGEYVTLNNRTHDTEGNYGDADLGADAVRFVYLSGVVPTNTPAPTNTPTITNTPTATRTPTRTYTPSKTYTPTHTFTPTRTFTPSNTRTASRTATSTASLAPTNTRWPSKTSTPSRTKSITPGPSSTRTTYVTETRWPTKTRTPSRTATPTRTQTSSRTPTSSRTLTSSRTPTNTRTFTPSRTFTASRTGSNTPGPSPTRTLYMTDTRWPTKILTATKTPGPSPTRTPSLTRSPTNTLWPSNTTRPTDTRWPTKTKTP